jgi:hypothetical protein
LHGRRRVCLGFADIRVIMKSTNSKGREQFPALGFESSNRIAVLRRLSTFD